MVQWEVRVNKGLVADAIVLYYVYPVLRISNTWWIGKGSIETKAR